MLLVTPDGKLQSQNTMGLKAVSMIVNSNKNIKKKHTHTHTNGCNTRLRWWTPSWHYFMYELVISTKAFGTHTRISHDLSSYRIATMLRNRSNRKWRIKQFGGGGR